MPAAQLVPLSLGVPAFLGLNTEKEASLLGPEWATELDNIVFDQAGRISSRKGARSVASVTGTVRALAEYTGGGVIAAAGNKLYLDGVDKTGTATVFGDYWKFVEFNTKIIGYQQGFNPVVYSGSAFSNVSVTHGGAMPTTWGNAALAAYGRIWTTDSSNTIIKYSGLLDETDFDASGTVTDVSAGYIDLKSVWKNGLDEVVAIEAHNGNLIIFGRKNIIVYADPMFPNSTMQVVENASGIGCIARDSVQVVGDDVWFLSASGVRSLGRTVVKDKMPLMDYSKNIRTYLINHTITVGSKNSIKSTYNETEGFYLLSVPESQKVFVFDVKQPLEDGSVRCSTWTSNVPTALLTGTNDKLYMGKNGSVGLYDDYQDYGSSFVMSYKSGWLSLDGQGVRYVIPKTLSAIVYTGRTKTLTFGWKFDFAATGFSATKVLSGITPSEYNVAEFNIGEYSGGGALRSFKVPLKGHGNLFRIEMSATIDGYVLAVQKIDVFGKLGRLN